MNKILMNLITRNPRKYEIRTAIYISLILCVFGFFMSYSIDKKNTENYAFLPYENTFKNKEYKEIKYYEYKNYAILRNLDETLYPVAFRYINELSKKYTGILLIEFSDFDKAFSTIKSRFDLETLQKIKYVHYIKEDEIKKLDNGIIVTRFKRALNERKIRYFMLPDDKKHNYLEEKITSFVEKRTDFDKITFFYPNYLISSIYSFTLTLSIFIFSPFAGVMYLITFLFFSEWSFAIAATFMTFIVYYKLGKANLLRNLFFSILFGSLIYFSAYKEEYIFKLESPRGIKLVLISLILLIILRNIKNIKIKNYKKYDIIILIVIIIMGLVYIFRSDNWSFVGNWERKIRDFIEKIFVSRPRTKELISYAFYYIKPVERYNLVWKISKSVLIISIFDTFLHPHIPYYLGLIRTLNGYLITLGIYLLAIGIKKIIDKKRTNK